MTAAECATEMLKFSPHKNRRCDMPDWLIILIAVGGMLIEHFRAASWKERSMELEWELRLDRTLRKAEGKRQHQPRWTPEEN